jgi:hypothetical protein
MKLLAFLYFTGMSAVAWSFLFARELRQRQLSIRSLLVATTLVAASLCGALAVPD